MDDDIPYLLLTPGPLTTSRTVRQAMLQDFCTWDDDYNSIVQEIRRDLVRIAGGGDYTCVLMQGSGTFTVEATVGSVVPPDGKLLVVNNGAYGARMAEIARRLRIPLTELTHEETEPADIRRMDAALRTDSAITHVAMVHCETTTGMLNPAAEAGRLVRAHGKAFILDAMSSFGGIPFTVDEMDAGFLISSANKCIQGVPGFGFVIARREALDASRGHARSVSLDLYAQWREMEDHGGKWRYTSPTHVVRAFRQALLELDEEGGVVARHERYRENHRRLVAGMERLGFRPLLAPELRSPLITSFLYPDDPSFSFRPFYDALKRRRFVIYPGKISRADTFRIGTIGHVVPGDIDALIDAVGATVSELGFRTR
ncbi:MAG: 2-aminoethylphosphonate--pyruvate transaminase [Dehalococcoidia bacterium]